MSVMECLFRSSYYKRRHNYVPRFSADLGPISHDATLPITFTLMPQARRGRYHDTLEITFVDTSASRTLPPVFIDLQAVVTEGEDHHLLKPTAPYKARERERALDDAQIIPCSNPPPLSDIVWKYRLTHARMPLALKKKLGDKQNRTTEEQINSLYADNLVPEPTRQNHSAHCCFLLFVEEYRLSTDLQQFNMRRAELTHVGDRFALHVPGLSEGRPSLIVGDRIIVRTEGAMPDEKWFEGAIVAIRLAVVEVRFSNHFEPGSLFEVRFVLNRLPLRRMHQALKMPAAPERILFPDLQHINNLFTRAQMAERVHQLQPGNRRIAQNRPQREAIANILSLQPGSAPFVVFGPPGTGKTVTIVEAMRQLTLKDPSTKILTCAPSNSAADLLAERLIGEGLNASQLFRLNAPSRSKDQILKKLLPFSLLNDHGTFAVPPSDTLASYTVVVSTCLTASVPYNLGLPAGHFSYVFVDEVGQAMEPEALIAMRTIGDASTRLIISGDPRQLGPVVRSPVAEQMGLGVSYLDRLMQLPAYSELWRGVSWVKLLKNWRSHEGILSYPNQAFYDNELEACADPVLTHSLLRFQRLPNPALPIIFHGLVGRDEREGNSPSYFNRDEASLVKKYVGDLLQDKSLRLKDSDFGIIAPYSAQCVKIRQLLRKQFPVANIKVGSVEEFQGQERRVIIISAVRSNPELVEHDARGSLGFVENPRRFNVAVTRAQALLIVIGNPDILELDKHWKGFMNYVYLHDGWTGHEPWWDTREPIGEVDLGELATAAIVDAEAGALSANTASMQDFAEPENTQAYLDERAVETSWRDAT
ncbi:P-loop containing nucleoside triphosphate hydrolase protein [Auricularia subglabra TFB-10046 SS5]|nr:P-loop containing nucleoside triphosphate hydrolase protein [Auricularia subglabra TFB-10046 SS5]